MFKLLDKTKVIPFLLFLAGFSFAAFMWNNIDLPFKNPYNVIGPYTKIEFNPSSEIVRFMIVILTPISLLGILAFVNRREKLFQWHINLKKPKTDVQVGRIWFPFVFLFAIVYALNIGIEKYLFDYFHDGESLGPAISFLAGQIPYEDYLFLHGYFQDPLRSVLAFKLFGQSISSLEIMDALLKIFTCILLIYTTYRLFRSSRNVFMGMLLLLIFLGIANRIWTKLLYEIVPVINLQSRDMCTFLFLLILIEIHERVLSSRKGNFQWMVLAFLVAFIPLLTFLYSVDRGYYLTAASIIMLPTTLLLLSEGGERKNLVLGALIGYLTGILTIKLVLGRGFNEFIQYYFEYLPNFKELVDGLEYFISEPPFFLTLMLVSGMTSWLAFRFFMFAREGKRGLTDFVRIHYIEIALAILSVFFFRSALGRSDYYHVAYVSVIIYLLAGRVVLYYANTKDQPKLNKSFRTILTFILILITTGGVARLFANENYLLKANFPIGVPDSTYLSEEYLETIEYLNSNLGEDESFFTLTNELCWYYFLNKPCPTRYHLVNFASPDFMQEEMVKQLSQANVKYILYNNEKPFNHFDEVGFRERLPVVMEYIHSEYEPEMQIGIQDIWIRSDMK